MRDKIEACKMGEPLGFVERLAHHMYYDLRTDDYDPDKEVDGADLVELVSEELEALGLRPKASSSSLTEKREEVVRRRAKARVYDGENCTSVAEEFEGLLRHGCEPVSQWSEGQCDEYLSSHGEDGQHLDEGKEDGE